MTPHASVAAKVSFLFDDNLENKWKAIQLALSDGGQTCVSMLLSRAEVLQKTDQGKLISIDASGFEAWEDDKKIRVGWSILQSLNTVRLESECISWRDDAVLAVNSQMKKQADALHNLLGEELRAKLVLGESLLHAEEVYQNDINRYIQQSIQKNNSRAQSDEVITTLKEEAEQTREQIDKLNKSVEPLQEKLEQEVENDLLSLLEVFKETALEYLSDVKDADSLYGQLSQEYQDNPVDIAIGLVGHISEREDAKALTRQVNVALNQYFDDVRLLSNDHKNMCESTMIGLRNELMAQQQKWEDITRKLCQ